MADFEKSEKKTYNAIVVGAGPAGCSAAYFLAKQDHDVLLVDRAKFPRDKVCGDAVSPRALAFLESIGASKKVETSGAFKVDGAIVSSPKGTVMKGIVPSIEGFRNYGYVFPRKDFDSLLLEHIQGLPNVEFVEKCKVKDVVYEEGYVRGLRAVHNGFPVKLKGEVIIGADGTNSIIAQKLSLKNQNPKHRAFGIRAYFDDVDGLDNYIEIHYDRSVIPGYAWIFPTGRRSANVGVGITSRFAMTKGIKETFKAFVEKSEFAAVKLKDARVREYSLKGWSIPLGSFPGCRSAGNVILTGDAGSMVDPLTGEGIYYALRSGELSAKALGMCLKEENGLRNLGRIYEKLWKKAFKWNEYRIGYFYQRFLRSEAFLNISISRAAQNRKKAQVLAGAIVHLLPIRRLFFSL